MDDALRGDGMDRETFAFVVYMIHVCAEKWKLFPSAVYRKLQAANCIDDYLVPFYDVLHTQSSAYVAEDIRKYLQNRGVTV